MGRASKRKQERASEPAAVTGSDSGGASAAPEPAAPEPALTRDRVSVQERIAQLTEMLEAQESMTFDELFADDHQRSDIIVTFLAILEMAKLSLIRIAQHVPTGIIRIFYQ